MTYAALRTAYAPILKYGWPLYAYLIWRFATFAHAVLQAVLRAEIPVTLVSEALKLLYEAATLAITFFLIAVRTTRYPSRDRWIDRHAEEVNTLAPLLIWFAAVLALHSATPWKISDLFQLSAGVVYCLWLLMVTHRQAVLDRAFETFREQVDYPVTRMADEFTRSLGGRIHIGASPTEIVRLKEAAAESVVRHLSTYVHGDERALNVLKGLRQRFPGEPTLRLAYHTLYSLREAYGSERFSIMMAALLDAHEKTMRTNRQSMSAIAHEDEAGHEAEGVGVQRLVQRLETLRLREQVQTALREEVIALVGYDMRPETAKAVDISGSTTAR